MSPEQMRSTKDVDARADVWALGAVAATRCVAGEPPFDAETMTALCAAILQDPPRPMAATRPDVPPQLEQVIRVALEKDRDRRFQNVAQLAAALAPFGSPAARASAERIARVLGVPAAVPQATAALDPRASNPAFHQPMPMMHPSPMAATTGGSGSITSDVARRSSGGAILAIAVAGFLVVAAAGTVGVVAWKKHAAAEGASPSATAASAATVGAVVTTPPPPPSAVVLADPGGTASPAPSSSAAPSARSASVGGPAGTAAGTAAPPSTTAPAGTGHPAWPPKRAPGVGGPQPPATGPAPTKPPSNSNPFGDDRRG